MRKRSHPNLQAPLARPTGQTYNPTVNSDENPGRLGAAPRPPGRGALLGRRLFWLLVPMVGLSLLLLLPDTSSLWRTQAAAAGHVILAILTLPLVTLMFRGHIRGRIRRPGPPRLSRSWARRLLRVLLLMLFLVGMGTGLLALWYGEGTGLALAHLVSGLALVLAASVHLSLEGRPILGASCTVGLAVSVMVGATLPDDPAPVPLLANWDGYETVPTAAYESAEWCGTCHEAIYEQWSRSSHSRAVVSPFVRDEFEHQVRERGHDLVFGDIDVAGAEIGVCIECHGPVTFYGDDATPAFESAPPVSEGVTCAFCHTLRGRVPLWVAAREQLTGAPRAGESSLSTSIAAFVLLEAFLGLPFRSSHTHYLSEPLTVRPYVGQADSRPGLRWIGDTLIRWRPEVHRRDYRPDFLSTSGVCSACHHRAFAGWVGSNFNTEDSETRVNCQDCHMVREMTGLPVREPGRHVSWGAVRPSRRDHQFLGGNVRTALAFDDEAFAATQHAYTQNCVEVTVLSARVEQDALRATVQLNNRLVGHDFPLLEFEGHTAWVGLTALDGQGRVVRAHRSPNFDTDTGQDQANSGLVDGGLVLGRDGEDSTPLAVHEQREITLTLPLGELGMRVTSVRVELMQAFDPEPISTAHFVLPAPQ